MRPTCCDGEARPARSPSWPDRPEKKGLGETATAALPPPSHGADASPSADVPVPNTLSAWSGSAPTPPISTELGTGRACPFKHATYAATGTGRPHRPMAGPRDLPPPPPPPPPRTAARHSLVRAKREKGLFLGWRLVWVVPCSECMSSHDSSASGLRSGVPRSHAGVTAAAAAGGTRRPTSTDAARPRETRAGQVHTHGVPSSPAFSLSSSLLPSSSSAVASSWPVGASGASRAAAAASSSAASRAYLARTWSSRWASDSVVRSTDTDSGGLGAVAATGAPGPKTRCHAAVVSTASTPSTEVSSDSAAAGARAPRMGSDARKVPKDASEPTLRSSAMLTPVRRLHVYTLGGRCWCTPQPPRVRG
jgi:hypothetical protein